MPDGKYFVIRSQLNSGLVLDIQGAVGDPETKVFLYEGHGGDNQQWFTEHRTGTIRSRLNPKMCLDFKDNRLIINDFNPGDPNQQWEPRGDHVCNREDGRVMDLVGGDSESGTEVCAWENHGGENQKWTFEHRDAEYFYVESKLHAKVLDIQGADASAGTKVIIWDKKDEVEDNQLWYEDRNGVIRAKLNDMVLDASGDSLCMNDFNPAERQHWWLIHKDRIANRYDPDRVMDISRSDTSSGAEVIPYNLHGGDNQLWNFPKA